MADYENIKPIPKEPPLWHKIMVATIPVLVVAALVVGGILVLLSAARAAPLTQAQLSQELGPNATTENFSGIRYFGSNETPPDNQWVIIGPTLSASTVIAPIANGPYASPAQGPGLVAPGVMFSTGANNTLGATTTLIATPTGCCVMPGNGILARFTNALDIAFSAAVNAVGITITMDGINGPPQITDIIDVYAVGGALLSQSQWNGTASDPSFFFGDQEAVDIGSIVISDVSNPTDFNGPSIANITFGDPMSMPVPEPTVLASALAWGLGFAASRLSPLRTLRWYFVE